MKPKTIALVAHDNRKKDLIEWVGIQQGNVKDTTCTEQPAGWWKQH